MGRAPIQRVEHAAQALLSDGERVTSTGTCWAAQVRPQVPLLLLARRKYLVALTNRRVLVFARRRGGPEPSDLIIGKRYETFTIDRVRRRRPLLQVMLRGTSGNRLVFEFRRGERELAGELIARLTPSRSSAAADEPSLASRLAPHSAPRPNATPPGAPRPNAPPPSAGLGEGIEDPAFWGTDP